MPPKNSLFVCFLHKQKWLHFHDSNSVCFIFLSLQLQFTTNRSSQHSFIILQCARLEVWQLGRGLCLGSQKAKVKVSYWACIFSLEFLEGNSSLVRFSFTLLEESNSFSQFTKEPHYFHSYKCESNLSHTWNVLRSPCLASPIIWPRKFYTKTPCHYWTHMNSPE